MPILVDADACPVKEAIDSTARAYGIEVIYVVSIAHWSDFYEGKETLRVDSEPEAADMRLMQYLKPGDLVITDDFGLAALALGKKAHALSFRGRIFSADEMDRLLLERYLKAKARRIGQYTGGPAKMNTDEQNHFLRQLTAWLQGQLSSFPADKESEPAD